MKQICDAIIIGSGIIGSAAAFALTRTGARRIALVEKGPLVSGMTRRNPGLVHPFYLPPTLSELASTSYPLYNQWAMHLPGKSPFVETGALLVSPGNSAPSAHETEIAELVGSNGIVRLDTSAAQSMVPSSAGSLRFVGFTPQAGYADAVLTAQALVTAAKERGTTVQTGTQAKRILVERGMVKGVETTTGMIEAPQIIVAAGGWSEKLLTPLGIALHLRYRRGAVLFYEQPRQDENPQPMILDASGTLFLRPHPYHMSAAGTIEPTAASQSVDSLSEVIYPNEAQHVAGFVGASVPALANATPKRGHTIMYDAPADGLPALGRVSGVDGLVVAAGFGASAFSVAPAVGEALAQILFDGSAARDLSLFDPARPGLMHPAG